TTIFHRLLLNHPVGNARLREYIPGDPMDNKTRPDLSERNILLLAAALAAVAALILLSPAWPSPGSISGQLSAAAGALLLLAPLCFVVMKRSGLSASPPTWFVVHVLATSLGCGLIFVHVASGDWLSPPGIVLLLLLLLIVQGTILRAVFSRGFSLLFARGILPTGFSAPQNLDKSALQAVIDSKVILLKTLDSEADEAQFSPALKHWLRRPLQSFRYQALAAREARMIGARAGASLELAWSRRIHMFAALAFYLGLLAHVVVVLFFAGYAAGGDPIDWWHITAWGS
ncbi:MAG: hypothetical protein OEN02_17625, partial [Gammaproteobacteria bacterium]|nr:hypothetical protein [Gammaproteobacteria bacterium]